MCRCPGCDRDPETGRFCSDRCEVKYDHLKDDARDAMLADRDTTFNEYAAHDAGRARQRVIENRRASYYRGRRI